MTNKSLLCPYLIAKKLMEMGVNQPSCMYYIERRKDVRGEYIKDRDIVIGSNRMELLKKTANKKGTEINFIPAYTSSELGDMLPNIIESKISNDDPLQLTQFFPNKDISSHEAGYVRYNDYDSPTVVYSGFGASEAESRADLLIEIINKGIISATDIKAVNTENINHSF